MNEDNYTREVDQSLEEKYWTVRRIIFLVIVIITIIAMLMYLFWPVLLGFRPAPEPPLSFPDTLPSV